MNKTDQFLNKILIIFFLSNAKTQTEIAKKLKRDKKFFLYKLSQRSDAGSLQVADINLSFTKNVHCPLRDIFLQKLPDCRPAVSRGVCYKTFSLSFTSTRFRAGLLNKSSRLSAASGATKLITIIAMYLSHFAALLKSDLDVQQTHLCAFPQPSYH